MLLGLETRDKYGARITSQHGLLRWTMKGFTLPAGIFCVSLILMAMKKRALPDMLAGTEVFHAIPPCPRDGMSLAQTPQSLVRSTPSISCRPEAPPTA